MYYAILSWQRDTEFCQNKMVLSFVMSKRHLSWQKALCFKKKDDMIKDKYRPISLLEIFSKVFETIVAEQLMEYFNDIFDPMLCVYRKKYSTEHVLIKLIDSWKYALDNDNFVGTVLMDLSKAFD